MGFVHLNYSSKLYSMQELPKYFMFFSNEMTIYNSSTHCVVLANLFQHRLVSVLAMSNKGGYLMKSRVGGHLAEFFHSILYPSIHNKKNC